MRRITLGSVAAALGSLAVLGDVSGGGKQLQAEMCGLLRTLPAPFGSYQTLAFSPDGRLLAVAGPTGEVQILRTGTWQMVQRFVAMDALVTDLDFSPDGRRLVVAGRAPEAVIWDLEAQKEVARLGAHGSHLVSAACSADGRRLAIAGADSKVRIIQAGTEREVGTLPGTAFGPNALAFTPDSRWLAYTEADGSIGLASAEDGKFRARVPVDAGAFTAVAADPASRRLFVGDSTGRVRALALPDASRLEGEWKLGDASVLSLAASRDGQYLLAAAGRDLHLIDLRRGGAAVRLSHHTGTVLRAEFEPGGRYIASVASDGHMKVWGNRPGGMKGLPPKGFFGIQVQDNASGRGISVTTVIPGTAAEKAGVREGDGVVRVGGIEVKNTAHAIALISAHLAGDPVEIVLEREGREVTIRVTLGKRPAEEDSPNNEDEDEDKE